MSLMIETHGLRKTFGGQGQAVEAVGASTWPWRAARSSASWGPTAPARPRPCGCWRRCMPPTGGEATVAGFDLRTRAGARSASGSAMWARPAAPTRIETGRRELVIQARLYGLAKAEAAPARRGDADAAGAGGRRGPQDEHLLRRPATPPGPRHGHDPSALAAVPRRADHRPRPAGPRPAVGRGAPPARGRAPRSSSRPTTSTRPMPCATAWPSSTTAPSWPRARRSSSSARSRATW